MKPMTSTEAVELLAGMRIFVTSRQRIKQPEGDDLFNKCIAVLRSATQPTSFDVCRHCSLPRMNCSCDDESGFAAHGAGAAVEAVAWYVFADTEKWLTFDRDEADQNRADGCQVRPLVFGDMQTQQRSEQVAGGGGVDALCQQIATIMREDCPGSTETQILETSRRIAALSTQPLLSDQPGGVDALPRAQVLNVVTGVLLGYDDDQEVTSEAVRDDIMRAYDAALSKRDDGASSLLRKPGSLPAGCFCRPGRCMAPIIQGKQMPCRDPEKAALHPEQVKDGATE